MSNMGAKGGRNLLRHLSFYWLATEEGSTNKGNQSICLLLLPSPALVSACIRTNHSPTTVLLKLHRWFSSMVNKTQDATHLETFSSFIYSRKVYNVILKLVNTLKELTIRYKKFTGRDQCMTPWIIFLVLYKLLTLKLKEFMPCIGKTKKIKHLW